MSQVNLAQSAEAIHDWIRGHDKVPGAWTAINGQVCFFSKRNANTKIRVTVSVGLQMFSTVMVFEDLKRSHLTKSLG